MDKKAEKPKAQKPKAQKPKSLPIALRPHPYPEVEEILSRHREYSRRSMFGVMTAYIGESLVMGFSVQPHDPVWDGVLLPCERTAHALIVEEFPDCVPHQMLPKWLFLPGNSENLESNVRDIARYIARGDPRFGIVPPTKKKKKSRSLKK